MRQNVLIPLLLTAAALAGGCAAVTTADGQKLRPGQAAFRDYVESVFRRQNAVLTELAFALDAADPVGARFGVLESAEADLLDACADLNALAAAAQRQRSRGAGDLAAARTAPLCERATESAQRVLQQPVEVEAAGDPRR